MEEKRISPLKAIRLKCLDCSCGSFNEVKLCPVEQCSLYPFREGHNPYTKKDYTPEERAALAARLMKKKSTKQGEESANAPSEGTYIPRNIPGENTTSEVINQ